LASTLRVSTKNGQTVDSQRQALTEAIGRRQGWLIVDEFVDKGISGSKGRENRPSSTGFLKRLCAANHIGAERYRRAAGWVVPASPLRKSAAR
jgi:DNA invertase Pin-like site-specific DNA recombinase